MAVNKRSRSAQYPLVAEYVFNFNDGTAMLASLGGVSVDNTQKATVTDFGSKASPIGLLNGTPYVANDNASTKYFEMFSLPLGAEILGGDLMIEAPYVGPSTATLALGNVNTGALYLAATSLIGSAWTNAPTGITNAGANPQSMTITNATANGISAVGQVITISGCTGSSALYNGSFVVESFTATQVVVTNAALTQSLTLAGTPAGTFITSRVALIIPGEETAQGGYSSVVNYATEAAAGAEIRASLALSGGQAATQGRIRVRVMYTIDGRSNEVITT